jgi:hypothetical protein
MEFVQERTGFLNEYQTLMGALSLVGTLITVQNVPPGRLAVLAWLLVHALPKRRRDAGS